MEAKVDFSDTSMKLEYKQSKELRDSDVSIQEGFMAES